MLTSLFRLAPTPLLALFVLASALLGGTTALDASHGTSDWAHARPLPLVSHSGAMVTAGGHVYLIGGSSADCSPTSCDEVWRAPIAGIEGGTAADWDPQPPLLDRWGRRRAAVVADRWLFVYVNQRVGGANTERTLYRYEIHPGTGDLTGPAVLAAPTVPRHASAFVAAQNNLYVISGFESNTTEFTRVDPTDGSIDGWQITQPTHTKHIDAAAVAYGDYVFVIAGNTGGSGAPALRTVESAEILPDGSLGPWNDSAAALPLLDVGRSVDPAAVVLGDDVWVIGGQSSSIGPGCPGTHTGAVERATFGPGGTLSAWERLADYPFEVRGIAAANVGARVYGAGGTGCDGTHDAGFLSPDLSTNGPPDPPAGTPADPPSPPDFALYDCETGRRSRGDVINVVFTETSDLTDTLAHFDDHTRWTPFAIGNDLCRKIDGVLDPSGQDAHRFSVIVLGLERWHVRFFHDEESGTTYAAAHFDRLGRFFGHVGTNFNQARDMIESFFEGTDHEIETLGSVVSITIGNP